jgi:hypothetical protein
MLSASSMSPAKISPATAGRLVAVTFLASSMSPTKQRCTTTAGTLALVIKPEITAGALAAFRGYL